MTDHEIKASFRGMARAAVGNPRQGGLVAVGSAPNLLEHADKVADAIRDLGQHPCRDAAHLRALEILTALQVVADAQVAKYAEANAKLDAARQKFERAAAAAAARVEGAKHQGEPIDVADYLTREEFEAEEIERSNAQANLTE